MNARRYNESVPKSPPLLDFELVVVVVTVMEVEVVAAVYVQVLE